MTEKKLKIWSLAALAAVVIIIVLCEVFWPMCQMDLDILDIQHNGKNCLDNALAIGAVRAESNLPTTIVLAWGAFARDDEFPAWHAFYRDEKGELQDSTDGTVFAAPYFEFEYRPGMAAIQQGQDDPGKYGGVCIVHEKKFVIEWDCTVNWPKYRITKGEGLVKILKESE